MNRDPGRKYCLFMSLPFDLAGRSRLAPALPYRGQEDRMASSIQQQPTDTFVPQVGRSVSIDQAAILLGVSRRTIYNHIKSGRLATLRTLGGSQRVLLVSLQQVAARPVSPWPQGRPLA